VKLTAAAAAAPEAGLLAVFPLAMAVQALLRAVVPFPVIEGDQPGPHQPNGDFGQQRQRRQPDQQPTWSRPVLQPKRRHERRVLRPRKLCDAAEKWSQQMQRRMTQVRLRLDARHPGDAQAARFRLSRHVS